MWVDIDECAHGKGAKNDKEWSLDVEPVLEYEVRVCVLGTEGIPCKDNEGTSDVYIQSYFDQDEKQRTDTHYRLMNG